MPFVKKVRDYYKDGVKVPSSSITDFGSYKYYKEFTTGGIELEYACYYSSGELGDEYYYAKAPIGNDLQIYGTRNKGVASSSSELGAAGTLVFSSLNEDTAVFGVTFNRYRDGDLYIDTTATEIVEVTAEDDYDFTEFVPSTEFDYYVDLNKLYQLAKPKRFYYNYSNEPNVTVVGNRAILKDGVASGFQTNISINTVEAFAPAAGDTWEMMFKLRTGTNITTQQQFLGAVTGNYGGIEIAVENGKFKWSVGTTSSKYDLASGVYGTYVVLPETDYWVKVVYDGANVTLYYSLDGVDFIQDIQVATTKAIYASTKAFGCDAGQNEYQWLGSIDFNETYINLNGERWWDITKPYVRDGFWIDEGVASGFSTSQYLSIPFSFNQAVQGCKWEIVGKFNTGTLGVRNPIYGGAASTYLMDVEVSASNTFHIVFSSNGSSYNIGEDYGSYIVLANTDYWVKVTFDGTRYALSYSLDGKDYIEDAVVESTLQIENTIDLLNIGFRSGQYLRGSIDLSECYVKINNRLWWHGTKVVEGDKDNYAFYEDRLLSYAPILKTGKQYVPLFESAVGGTYEVTIPEDANVRVTMVGGGGAAAIRGVYDDKGYGWSGGSGGAFIGTFALPKGTYSVTVGSANNNTKGQGGNSATLNPTDLTTHDSYIDGVVRVGGGGYGYYKPSAAGAAGAAATFDIEPLSITMNKAGNAGTSGSGGKGSAAAKTVSGGASVWGGYGTGQGCKTSEYASKRGWINGTGGYVRIEMWTQTGEQLY